MNIDVSKIFVISPREMVERRRQAQERFKGYFDNPIFYSGLYGRDVGLLSKHNDPSRPYAQYKQMTSSSMCLSLNHWFLWQHIVLAEIPVAMIFEDDVVLPYNFEEFYAKNMDNTPKDWDMTYMSLLYPDRIDDGRIGAHRVRDNVWKHDKAEAWDGACDGLHAYLMTLEGARKATSVRLKLDEPMDRWMSFNILPHMSVYLWKDSPIVQLSQHSDDEVWKSTYIGDKWK